MRKVPITNQSWFRTLVTAAGCSALLAISAAVRPTVPPSPQRIATLDHIGDAEALSYDPATDVYFVSDVNGNPGVKDGNGSIVRISGDGKLQDRHFIQGGHKGVTLNAPMGSRVHGDTLWVLDVDVLRGFDTHSGAPLGSVDLAPAGALFLNDFDYGPDGSMYVTDMRLRAGANGELAPTGPGRIYQIGADHRVRIALESAELSAPDGLGWDAHGKRVIIAPFSQNPVQQWHPGTARPDSLAAGKGRFDGVEVEPDGSILITSWNDSTVSTLQGNRLIRKLGPLTMTPADVSMDTRRGRVGVVSMEVGRFELWTWPK